MTKVKITKAMGEVEELNLLSAFKVDSNSYVILDGDKLGSMGLPIIYVSKLTDKLEKINDTNEWQSAKNYLKGIINGTNFEYIKIANELQADEVYYTPLTLPSASSLELIKSRYVVPEDSNISGGNPISNTPVVDTNNPSSIPEIPVVAPAETSIPPIPEVPVTPTNEVPVVETTPTIPEVPNIPITNEIPPVPPVAPVMPDNNVVSNTIVTSSPTPQPIPEPNPVIAETPSQYVATPVNTPVVNNTPEVSLNPPIPEVTINNPIPTNIPNPVPPVPTPEVQNTLEVNNAPMPEHSIDNLNFDNDKETFLKACENMFDALVSKYQKQLNDLNEREKQIKQKESEIDQKLFNANEHLANAEAREQVANIVHDNAQKVMDLNNFMPTNNNQAGVL